MILLGQQDSNSVFYRQQLQLNNPAATGIDNRTLLSATHRKQWAGIEGAPTMHTFAFAVPGGESRLAYGAIILSDQTFVERKTHFFGTFSYRLPLSETNTLFLGIQGGGIHTDLNFEGINVTHQGDANLQHFSRFYPNIGVGAYLKLEQFYFSLSSPLLFSYKTEKEREAILPNPVDDLHFYFSAGTHFPAFNEHWNWVASVLTRWVSQAPTSMVFNAGLDYKGSELTVAYHQDSSLGGTFVFNTKGMLSIGYSYQFSTAPLISKLHAGNHEFFLRYRFNGKPNEPEIESETIEKTVSRN